MLVSEGAKTSLSGQNKNFLSKDCVILDSRLFSSVFRVTGDLSGLTVSWKVRKGTE